ncbi:polyprenyl synthetase family protein [Bacillus sp. RD4P76]|uniref:Polyprenyl synthetase family protein n=2 Tax=Bacillus suaedaesalsae TaxID=2810349 RepID=A0ABS2DFU6_9BACI|nr:farnesyl diphosphate synthase [Bacillus suaedaesalsae]MBM6617343.1 polyprenyl synthetase family protein [Bacillus suaedaesalsae]
MTLNTLSAPSNLLDAMNYSLQAGGKRIRPLLLFATLSAFNKNPKLGLPVATAIEMIHTYSLIHDDLPSMDNDDLRRGKPTNHKVYGEALAILAGDALLTYSFQLLAELNDSAITDMIKLKLIQQLAIAAGPEGMVGGQVADMEGENKSLTIHELEYIHERKTGKLLEYSIIAGALLSEATEEQLKILREFSRHLGLAFQIRDDILDIEGTVEEIGKPVGSDITNRKSTYPSVLTLDGAKEKLNYHITRGKELLHEANIQHNYLEQICDLIALRNN